MCYVSQVSSDLRQRSVVRHRSAAVRPLAVGPHLVEARHLAVALSSAVSRSSVRHRLGLGRHRHQHSAVVQHLGLVTVEGMSNVILASLNALSPSPPTDNI